MRAPFRASTCFAREAAIRIPILLYNIPQFSNRIEGATAESLIRDGIVHGVKDSSGEWPFLEHLIGLRKEQPMAVMVGSDGLFAGARSKGASGVVSGIASALPELLLAIERAVSGNMNQTIDRLQNRLLEFIGWIDRLAVPVGIKEAATLRGLKLGPHAIPPSAEQRLVLDSFREWFTGWLPAVLNECRNP